jgi:hypothetical protein
MREGLLQVAPDVRLEKAGRGVELGLVPLGDQPHQRAGERVLTGVVQEVEGDVGRHGISSILQLLNLCWCLRYNECTRSSGTGEMLMDAQPDIVAQLAGALAPKPRPGGFSAFEEYDTVTEWERFADDTNE